MGQNSKPNSFPGRDEAIEKIIRVSGNSPHSLRRTLSIDNSTMSTPVADLVGGQSCRRRFEQFESFVGERRFPANYLPDNHLVQVHTVGLASLAADAAMKIKGVFKTDSEGTDPGSPNAFMFPTKSGGWRVYRFSPGASEAVTWDQGEGWTSCNYNVPATIATAATAEGGILRPDGSYVFSAARNGLIAIRTFGRVRLSCGRLSQPSV